VVFDKDAPCWIERDGIEKTHHEDSDGTSPSVERLMNLSEVVRHVRSVVEQARADHAIGDAPISKHRNVVRFHATVHLNLHGTTSGGDLLFNGVCKSANFALHVWNKGLTSKSRVDAHDEHQVDFAEDFKGRFNRRGGVEDNTDAGASFANGSQQSVQVFDGFNVHGKVVATRIDVILETGLCVFNHEVGIKHGIGAQGVPKASDHGWTEGEVGYEIPVHYVKMKPIEARFHRFLAVGGEVSEIGR
jgi:hypothetical protein